MDSEHESNCSFEKVVILNEAAKALLARSAQVNLLALDAMVQSKRGDGNLRGFDEVSSQMRSWSRELHQELGQLGELSATLLSRTSLRSKHNRKLVLLEKANAASENADLRSACVRCRAEQGSLDAALGRDMRRIRNLLGDIDQLGLMAIVLSRAAMIEAVSGDEQQRAQLHQVSSEFYRNSEAVLETIRSTIAAVRPGA